MTWSFMPARSGKSCASSCRPDSPPPSTNGPNLESQPMIELVNLVKKFGDITAVNDISLTIPRGEFFAMLGPNAAGKTTTLKLLAGLMKPTSGAARVCGFDMQLEPLEARRRIAYVPDFPFLYDKLTAWEFFRFTGQLFQMDAAKIEANAEELIVRFHLQDFV